MISKSTKYQFEIQRDWHLIDAGSGNLGRISSQAAKILQGKHKAVYSPQADTGDFIIIVNTKYLKVSHPTKWDDKMYHKYSGYPGGLYSTSLKEMVEKDPNKVFEKAISRMLPKNKLRAKMMNRLKLFSEYQEGRELWESMKKRKIQVKDNPKSKK